MSLGPLALCPVHLNSSPGSFLCFLSTKACTVPLGQKSSLCKSLRCLHRQRASPKHLECAFCPWRGLLLVSLVLPPGEEARGHTAPAEARVALERAPPPPPQAGMVAQIVGGGEGCLVTLPGRIVGSRSWPSCLPDQKGGAGSAAVNPVTEHGLGLPGFIQFSGLP